MKQRNKLFLLFSSAVLGSTLAIAIPQNTSTISAETVAAQPAAVNPSAPYANGVYPNTPMAYHKSGTQETSTMAQFMKPEATVTIDGANATLSFPAKSKSSADMVKKFTVNGKPTVRKGNAFEVIVPSTSINGVLKGYVEIVADIGEDEPFQEKQPVDIQINTSSIKKAEAPKPENPKTDQQKKAEQESENRRKEQQKQEEKKQQAERESENRRKEQQQKADDRKRAQEREQDRKSGNPANKQDIVDYTANYKNKTTGKRSTMAKFMSTKATMYYKGGHQYIVISANSPASANMIKDMKLNGHGYFKKSGNEFYFNLGTKEISKRGSVTFDGKVSVSTRLSSGEKFTENPEFTLTLTNPKIRKGDASSLRTGSGSIGKPVPSANTNKSNGASGGSVAVAKNSYYNYSAKFLKQGTSESSVMANYMLNAAHVEIKGNNAIITVFANSASSANMITHMTLGGQTASRSGNGYTVTLPKSELESVIAGHVDVDVPGVIHESQPFSLRLTPGFSGTPSAGGDSSSAEGAMGGNAFPMGSASNLNAANANSLAAAKKAADNAKKNGAKNGDNIKNPDATAQDKDKEKSDMNKTFLSIGGIISAVLGYIGTTLGWNIFRG